MVDTTSTAFGNDTLGPIFGRLFGELYGELDRLGVAPTGPQLALYEPSEDPDSPITVMAAVPIHEADAVRSDRGGGVGLPALAPAPVAVHPRAMAPAAEG